MRKILLLSAAVMAVLAGPALAQRGDDNGRGDRGGERGSGRPAAAAPAAPAPAAPAPKEAPAPTAPQAAAPSRAEAGRQSMQRQQDQRAQAPNRDRNNFAQRGDNRGDNRPDANRANDNRPDVNRGGNNGRADFGRNDNRPGNNGVRGRPNPGYAQYHRSFNAPHQFRWRGPTYRQPPGFYYQRWSYGQFLPSLFWGSNYWISDFSYYDLMPPPPGTTWVRYGPDALLIDRYTGEVIQVEYSVFY